MKFATAFGLLHFAVASSGVAGASASAAVGPRAGADADAPEPQQLRHRALAEYEPHDESILKKPNISSVKPVPDAENVEIFVFDGCNDIEDAPPCHHQVITHKDAISGTEHLFVNTHNWCTDSPFLKIKMKRVGYYEFDLPGHRPKSGTCGDPSEDCFVNMGSHNVVDVCSVYRTILTMDDVVAAYADCLDENGHTFGGFCKCDDLLQTIQVTGIIVTTLAANLGNWLQTARPSFQESCQSGEPRLQHIEFCNTHADYVDALDWLNEKKESLCIG